MWRGGRRYATRGIGKERDDTVIDFGCRGGDPMGQVSGIRAQGFRKVLSSTMKIILARDLILVNFSRCHTRFVHTQLNEPVKKSLCQTYV